MARIFWDTNLFIYLFERNPDWSSRVIEFRKRMIERSDQLVTSYLTLGEVLTKPQEAGNTLLVKSYRNFFTTGPVEMIPFGLDAAIRYGEIRASTRIRPADAVQLACAASAQIDLFVTNDNRLSSLVVPGVTFLAGIDRIPY